MSSQQWSTVATSQSACTWLKSHTKKLKPNRIWRHAFAWETHVQILCWFVGGWLIACLFGLYCCLCVVPSTLDMTRHMVYVLDPWRVASGTCILLMASSMACSQNHFQQTQHICITFIQCWTNVEDVGPTLYKCYTKVLCLLGSHSGRCVSLLLYSW